MIQDIGGFLFIIQDATTCSAKVHRCLLLLLPVASRVMLLLVLMVPFLPLSLLLLLPGLGKWRLLIE